MNLGMPALHIDAIRNACLKFVTGKIPGTIGISIPAATQTITKSIVVIVVIKQLSDHHVRTSVNLAFQIIEVGLCIGCFLVDFWITGNRDSEVT